jgi:hypothetical protein
MGCGGVVGKLTKVTQPPPNPTLDSTPLLTACVFDENRNRIRQTDASLHLSLAARPLQSQRSKKADRASSSGSGASASISSA